mmetsp:Transcript_35528/g.58211  ORF Transcript_35528/g.58211 Transcript_35528/m.58211 type:complete len:252 (+) Transcript_35528:206-961(+)
MMDKILQVHMLLLIIRIDIRFIPRSFVVHIIGSLFLRVIILIIVQRMHLMLAQAIHIVMLQLTSILVIVAHQLEQHNKQQNTKQTAIHHPIAHIRVHTHCCRGCCRRWFRDRFRLISATITFHHWTRIQRRRTLLLFLIIRIIIVIVIAIFRVLINHSNTIMRTLPFIAVIPTNRRRCGRRRSTRRRWTCRYRRWTRRGRWRRKWRQTLRHIGGVGNKRHIDTPHNLTILDIRGHHTRHQRSVFHPKFILK